MADKNQVLGRKGRVEREQRYNKIVIFSSIAVVATIIIVLIVGLVMIGMVQPRQAILEVNDTVIDTTDFQTRVRLTRFSLVQQYMNSYENMVTYGQQNPQLISYFDQELQRIEFQLSPSFVGENTIQLLTEAILVREAAEEMGITVSEEEIAREMEENFGYFRDGQPDPTATMLPYEFSPTQLAMITLTPSQEERNAKATDEASGEETGEETTEPTAAPTFETPPTATIIPTEEFGVQLEDNLQLLADEIQADESFLIQFFTERLYREKILEAVTADVPTEQEMVWARHILVATEKDALIVYEALQKGEDWSMQAAVFSLDEGNKLNGGDLGWFTSEMMVPEFSAVAFVAEVGTISEPVESEFGWHLIQIIGHEMRPLDAQQLQQAKEEAYFNWLEEKKSAATIVIHEYWIDRVPDTPTVPLDVQQQVNYVRQQLEAPAPLPIAP